MVSNQDFGFEFDLQLLATDPPADPPANPPPTDPPKPNASDPPADPPKRDGVSQEYHDRVKRERDEAQAQLRQIEKDRETAERDRLAKQGEFEKVAEKAERARDEATRERDKVKADYQQKLILREVRAVAAELGLENREDAQFIKLDGVEYDADKDEVRGVKDAVERFKAAHPRFFKADSLEDPSGKPEGGKKPGSFVPPGATNGKPGEKSAFDMNDDEFDREFTRRFPSAV